MHVNNQSDLYNRFDFFLEYAEVELDQFCLDTGIDKRFFYGSAKTKINLKAHHFHNISIYFPYLNMHWLITGQGSMTFPELDPKISKGNFMDQHDFYWLKDLNSGKIKHVMARMGLQGFQLAEDMRNHLIIDTTDILKDIRSKIAE